MKKKIIIGSLIVAVTAAAIAGSIMKRGSSQPVFGGGKSVLVQTARITKGDLSSYISSDGYVREVEKSEVFFETPLRVTSIIARKNQTVKKGDKLLEVDMDALYSELEKLKLRKTSEELALDPASADAEISKAKSALNGAEREFSNAKKAFDRDKSLFQSGALSKSDYDRSETRLNDARDSVDTARTAYNALVAGKDTDRRIKEENLKATVLGISDLEKKIKKINEALYSQIDGAVAEQNVEAGSYTDIVRPAFIIVNVDNLEVRTNVKEYDLKGLAVGQKAKITGDAIGKDAWVNGTVKSISPVATTNNTSSGQETVIEVTVQVENGEIKLKPGLSVTCDISTSEKKGILIAPMDVIDEDKDGNKYIYVVDEGKSTMLRKPVKIGVNSEMSVEILEGVNEGDMAVINPQPTFKDGLKVRIMDNGKSAKK